MTEKPAAPRIPVHLRLVGETRWHRGWAERTTGLLAVVRTGPGGRRRAPLRVTDGHERAPTSEERWWIHRHGGSLAIGRFRLHDGGSIDLAVRREHAAALFGGDRLEEAA